MDGAEFKRWFKGSPVERTRRKRLQRNVAIAMGNSGERRFFAQLKAWTTTEDSVLAEAAEWATNRIRRMESEHNQAAMAGGEDREAG
jgi:epoxyqueuosine reductase